MKVHTETKSLYFNYAFFRFVFELMLSLKSNDLSKLLAVTFSLGGNALYYTILYHF